MGAIDVHDFPSDAWFQAMVADTRARPEVYRRLGFGDFRLVVAVEEPARTRCFGLVLDGYDALYAGELHDLDAFRADATLSGSVNAWHEMIATILEHGGADGPHTLNALTIADVPLRVSSPDPLGRDKFFRYAQTLQTLFDALATRRPVATP